MATGVTYHDESTITEVYTALHGNNDLDFPTVLAAVKRLQDTGILFRKEVPEHLRPTRKTREGSTASEILGGELEADASMPVTTPTTPTTATRSVD